MCLKPRLPHVRVLQPAEVAEQVRGDFQAWPAWQGTAWLCRATWCPLDS